MNDRIDYVRLTPEEQKRRKHRILRDVRRLADEMARRLLGNAVAVLVRHISESVRPEPDLFRRGVQEEQDIVTDFPRKLARDERVAPDEHERENDQNRQNAFAFHFRSAASLRGYAR